MVISSPHTKGLDVEIVNDPITSLPFFQSVKVIWEKREVIQVRRRIFDGAYFLLKDGAYAGRKISLIKFIKNLSLCSLLEAKYAVDAAEKVIELEG
ncbi:MAG: hypothetical protein AABY07_00755 [Nanoarchaeota archaeon]